MNKEAALDAPSKHKNILIVDINGLVDMRDLKEKQLNKDMKLSLILSMQA